MPTRVKARIIINIGVRTIVNAPIPVKNNGLLTKFSVTLWVKTGSVFKITNPTRREVRKLNILIPAGNAFLSFSTFGGKL
jgi:hypothetical protein